MANISITQLPAAQALTGFESVPVVQNGVTVQTTTGDIANSPVLNQTFLTVGAQPGLANSRYIGVGAGLGSVDTGAAGLFSINLIDAPLSLVTSSTGFQVKTSANTLTGRSIAVGNGLGVSNADGVSGDPLITYAGLMSNLAALSGTGLVAINGTTATPVNIAGTASQIAVTNGNGIGSPTIGLADNPVLPGVGAVTVPSGTTLQRPAGVVGKIRYNLDTGAYEAFQSGVWRQFSLAGGVTQVDTGTGLLGGPITGAGTISVDLTIIASAANTLTLTSKTIDGASNTLSNIANSSLTNSAITINGNAVSLGGTTTVTATASNALTIGTGLSGTSYNGSAAVTVAIDSTVATLTGVQTLTNKTITAPVITAPIVRNKFKYEGPGVNAYTQLSQALGSWISNTNDFQVVYNQNQSNGSDASADWSAYNDISDGLSYFVDMGINSSNYSSVTFPIFTPNSAYLFTGGGTSGQATDLFFGTSNAASNILFFTGGVTTANVRGSIRGNTGNWLVKGTTDTGEALQVTGTVKVTGATAFGGTVLLSADPTLPLQATTKRYVDTAVSTGFTVHAPVSLATTAALPANTYANGASGVGATLTAVAPGVLTVDGVAAPSGIRVLIKNEAASANNGSYTVTVAGAVGVAYVLTRTTDFDQAAAGEIANNAYFFVLSGSTLGSTSYVLSQVAAITVGTTSLPFTLFASVPTYIGGTNIDVTGQTISLTGVVAATNGGTGTGTVTTGDLLYGSAINTWSKFPIGIAYKSLVVNASGTQIEWNAVALNQATAVSGQLGTSNGGTNTSASPTAGGASYGTGTAYAFTAAGTAGQVLKSNGASAPTWSGVSGGTF